MMEIFPDAEAVAHAAAQLFVERGCAAQTAQRRFFVALAGGSTPRRMYELLAEKAFRDRLDWARVEFFWGDERTVPADHSESNYRMAHETLLSRVAVPPACIHRMQAERADLPAAAQNYQEDLARTFGLQSAAAPPRFDLILLGMGPDGHTASLFPHTAALAESQRWVVANAVPQKSTQRLTFTFPLINAAALVLFVVSGADKADALASILEGPQDRQQFPAQAVAPVAGELLWYVDRAAAAKLTRTARG